MPGAAFSLGRWVSAYCIVANIIRPKNANSSIGKPSPKNRILISPLHVR